MSTILKEELSSTAVLGGDCARETFSCPSLPLLEDIDAHALALRDLLNEIVRPLGSAAHSLLESEGWKLFGAVRLDDYARERLRRSGRWLRDLAALEKGLRAWPRLAAAFDGTDGGTRLGQVASIAISRIANPVTIEAWIERARSVTYDTFKEDLREARAKRHRGTEAELGCPLTERERWQGMQKNGVYASRDRQGRVVGELKDPDAPCIFNARVTAPVVAAFQEGLELHRAASGQEASAASYVEALIAEHRAGPLADVNADQSAIVKAIRRHVSEEEHRVRAEAAARWSRKTAPIQTDKPEVAEARALVERALSLLGRECEGGSVGQDARLQELAALEGELLRSLGRLLQCMRHYRVFHESGKGEMPFVSIGHYAEERLGISSAQGERLARLARGAVRFPTFGQAYEAGRLGIENATLVLSVLERGRLDADEIAKWVRRGEKSTTRRLRLEVRVAKKRQLERPRASAGSPLSSKEWYSALRREPGQSLEELVRLAQKSQEWGVSWGVLRIRLPRALAYALLATVEELGEGLARQFARERGRPFEEPTPHVPYGSARDETFSGQRGPWKPCSRELSEELMGNGLLLLMLDHASTWDQPRNTAPCSPPTRHPMGQPMGQPVGQSMGQPVGQPGNRSANRRSPAESTYERDGYRCMAPGCTSRAEIQEHHIVFRSKGGSEKPTNRVSLCAAHHLRGVHAGLLRLKGKAGHMIEAHLGRPDVAVAYRDDLRI